MRKVRRSLTRQSLDVRNNDANVRLVSEPATGEPDKQCQCQSTGEERARLHPLFHHARMMSRPPGGGPAPVLCRDDAFRRRYSMMTLRARAEWQDQRRRTLLSASQWRFPSEPRPDRRQWPLSAGNDIVGTARVRLGLRMVGNRINDLP
jgi:hypothetical protein